MDWEAIEGIVYSEEDHPENILGPHKIRGGFLVQTFIPGAQEVTLQLRKSGKTIAMELADEAGFFAAILPEKKPVSYFYNVVYDNGDRVGVGCAHGEEGRRVRYSFCSVGTECHACQCCGGF